MKTGTAAIDSRKVLKEYLPIVISFLVPVIIIALAYAANGIYPFGAKTILISDMEGQYIDFYSRLYGILKDKGSLFYSWQAGMGYNFTGLFAYYLSSPFSMVILFFQKNNLFDALYFMTLLKIGAAGLSFYVYLKYLYRELPGALSIMFSSLHALMSYCIVYSFNIMWLDGIILLPLVLLGVEKIIKQDKFILFTICLSLSFIANFYISYMVGLFSFLYFISNFYIVYGFERRIFVRKLIMFILSAILSGGLAAFLMVPAFFALKNGLIAKKLSILDLGINFKSFALLGKLSIGSYDTITVGLPNIYCGLLTVLTASLFFMNRKVKAREKAVYLTLLIFFMLCFVFSILDLFWHCFDHPDWFPFRYSFLFSFLLISLAVKCFAASDGIDKKMIIVTGIIWIIILVLARVLYYNYLKYNLLIINIIFLIAFTFLLYIFIGPLNRKRAVLPVLVFFVLFESFLNASYLISGLDREFGYETREKYNKSLSALDNLISKVEEEDKSFYRIDRTAGAGRSFNDSMNLNYKGITHFGSMINGRLNNFLGQLGFMIPVTAASDYTGATLVTDSLLGVKYIITDRVRGSGYREILMNGNLRAYENIYALPVGFIVDKGLLNLKVKDLNPFELQNEILNLSMGNEKGMYFNYLSPLTVESVELKNAALRRLGKIQDFRKIDRSRQAFVELTIVNPIDQEVYGYLPGFYYSVVDVYVNGNFLENYQYFYNNSILDLGYHHRGEKIKLKLVLNEESFSIKDECFYGLDETDFGKAIKRLKSGSFVISQFKDTLIRGNIDVNGGGLLFTSIPYDKGWSAYIDGNKSAVEKVGDALIGVEISKGHHEVKLKFIPQGFRAGVVISCISLIILALSGIKFKN